MSNMTPQEQLMLELINRARMDPAAEAARYGISLNEGPPSTTITSTAKQVLAGNVQLNLSADKHSDWIITNDTFSHYEGSGSPHFYGADPFVRMSNAGYSGASTRGENIALVASTGALDTTQAIIDMERSLFVDAGLPGRGHRIDILNADFKEVGLGQFNGTWTQTVNSQTTNYNGSVITQDFGARSDHTFITGVVYNDTVTNDNFFTVGEQTAGKLVDGGGASNTTGAGGGYELDYATTGSKTVTFHLTGGNLVVKLSLGTTNAKVDAVNGKEIWTNASLTSQSSTIKELHALGISKMNLTGSSTSEKIYGNKADNILTGNGGNDTLTGSGGKDQLIGGSGTDSMSGGSGDDKFIFKVAAESGAGSAKDTIADFDDSGNDAIDLSAVYSGNLTYQDEAAFTGANQIRVTASGNDVLVRVNLDANTATDEMQILLKATTLASMDASDFIV